MTNSDRYNMSKHDLSRFVEAQADSYQAALSEIKNGEKQSHWMWFIFPQYAGLGLSPTSQRYAIKSLAEARTYLFHSVTGPRLRECAEALLAVRGRSARQIFGVPDDAKLKSSCTLFTLVAKDGSSFHRLLGKYFDGALDERTLQLVRASGEPMVPDNLKYQHLDIGDLGPPASLESALEIERMLNAKGRPPAKP